MAIHVARDNIFFAFSAELQTVVEVSQGEEIIIETHDCFEGQLKSKDDLTATLDWNRVNPATGPVYITGIEPGDVLRIDLLDIQLDEKSIVVAIPGAGALGDIITEPEMSVMPIEGGYVKFKDKVSIPLLPMIGVIGVAPAFGSIPNGTPGKHGGNMDCTIIGKGASVYLTAEVDGALLGCGDLHAVMGDGEIVVTGAEVSGVVCLKAVKSELKGLPTPFVETNDVIATIFSAKTIDEATSGAIHRMAKFLTGFAKLSINDAGMLMSLVGSLKFCQVVDPLMTVRFEFPKSVFEDYGYQLR